MPKINLFVLFIALVMQSCVQTEDTKQGSIGRPMDVIVSSDAVTMKELRGTISGVFESPQPYFVFGTEPYFNSINVYFDGLNGQMLRQKTIVLLVHDENKKFLFDEFGINVKELELKMKDGHSVVLQDLWATSQHVIVLYTKTRKEMTKYLESNAEEILNTTLVSERKDLADKILTTSGALENYEKIKKEYGCGVAIPGTYKLAHHKDGFFWFMEDTENYTSSITVYAFPYEDTSQFNTDYLIAKRDSMSKVHIPGQQKGTYMTTVGKDKYYRYKFNSVKRYNGTYTKTIRGMWTVKGEFKSGPFISYCMLHEPTNQIMIIEGFLMYPDTGKPKAPFLRIYEALPWSFK